MKGAYLTLTPGQEALEGSRCPDCGEHFYPPRVVCLNCFREGLETVALSRTGKLYTFTIARMALPGTLVPAPYVIAQVELPEGIHVATVLSDVDPETVKIGMELEFVSEKAGVTPEGSDIITFKFRPAQ
jgi:uncharacterized OB-fold protein